MRNQKLLRLVSALAMVLVLAFALAGCTSPDDSANTPENSAPAVNGETSQPETLESPLAPATADDTQESAPAASDETTPADDEGATSPDTSETASPESTDTKSPDESSSASPEDTTTAE